MFAYPATSLFNTDGVPFVVWSEEEFNARLSEGCTEDAPNADAEEPAQAKKRGKR